MAQKRVRSFASLFTGCTVDRSGRPGWTPDRARSNRIHNPSSSPCLRRAESSPCRISHARMAGPIRCRPASRQSRRWEMGHCLWFHQPLCFRRTPIASRSWCSQPTNAVCPIRGRCLGARLFRFERIQARRRRLPQMGRLRAEDDQRLRSRCGLAVSGNVGHYLPS